MKVSILSNDKRFLTVQKCFCALGWDARIEAIPKEAKIVVLPPKKEHTDEELAQIATMIDEKAIVCCGEEIHFCGTVVRYSEKERFLKENARLSAEGAIAKTMTHFHTSLYQKKILILGYGRIGKSLAKLLLSIGANVCVYARREEKRKEAKKDGCRIGKIDLQGFDFVYNTIPSVVVSKEKSENTSAHLIELASAPGGFEEKSHVLAFSGIPGEILPESAGEVIFDEIISSLPFFERNYL